MVFKQSAFRSLASLILVALVSGCASLSPSSDEKIQQALALDTVDSVDEYILGATDVVRVSVWRNADLSISVPVRPDGMISIPLIGDMRATGKKPETLADDIEIQLAEYIREPQVSVVVTNMGSHDFIDRVRVTGAVKSPLSVQHRAGMTVLDMFLSAGGSTPFAEPNSAMLYRPMDNEVVAIPVRLDDILNRGDISTNYSMRPGDILAVPERSF